MNRARINRMIGKWIHNISFDDLRNSSFEEYMKSRILGSRTIFELAFKSSRAGRILYEAEYNSYREQVCKPLGLSEIDLEGFKRDFQQNKGMNTLTETIKKVELTEGHGKEESLAEKANRYISDCHSYCTAMVGAHSDEGNLIRYLLWSISEVCTRRS